MRVKFARWGHSVALRIPSSVVHEISAFEGAAADLSVQDGKLIVAPVQTPTYDLAELVAGITDENRHGEIKSTYAVGEEFA